MTKSAPTLQFARERGLRPRRSAALRAESGRARGKTTGGVRDVAADWLPLRDPYIVVCDAAGFIAFLVSVFEGSERGPRELRTDGTINHADVLIGDSVVMISEADETFGARPCVNFAYVEDVDTTYDRAIAVGARSLLAPTDQSWGDRVGGVVDPFDNRWWIATRTRDAL